MNSDAKKAFLLLTDKPLRLQVTEEEFERWLSSKDRSVLLFQKKHNAKATGKLKKGKVLRLILAPEMLTKDGNGYGWAAFQANINVNLRDLEIFSDEIAVD